MSPVISNNELICPDMLVHICTFLGPRELFKLRKVSKQLRDLVDANIHRCLNLPIHRAFAAKRIVLILAKNTKPQPEKACPAPSTWMQKLRELSPKVPPRIPNLLANYFPPFSQIMKTKGRAETAIMSGEDPKADLCTLINTARFFNSNPGRRLTRLINQAILDTIRNNVGDLDNVSNRGWTTSGNFFFLVDTILEGMKEGRLEAVNMPSCPQSVKNKIPEVNITLFLHAVTAENVVDGDIKKTIGTFLAGPEADPSSKLLKCYVRNQYSILTQHQINTIWACEENGFETK